MQQAAVRRATGEMAALLHRDWLYSSHLTVWRQQAPVGARRAFAQSRDPTATHTTQASVVARLERENTQLRDTLARAELMIALPQNWQCCWLTHPRQASRPRDHVAAEGCRAGRRRARERWGMESLSSK